MGSKLLPVQEHPDEILPTIDEILQDPNVRERLEHSVSGALGTNTVCAWLEDGTITEPYAREAIRQ